MGYCSTIDVFLFGFIIFLRKWLSLKLVCSSFIAGRSRKIWDGCRPSRRHSKTEFVYIVWFIFSETAKSIIWANGNGADEYRRRHTPIDIAVALVGFLLVGGEGRDTGGVGGLDDGIEVERYGSRAQASLIAMPRWSNVTAK